MVGVWRVALELTVTAALGVVLLCMNVFGVPRHQAIPCSDASIRYPYRDSTVPSWTVFLFGVVVNVFTICLGEYLLFRRRLLQCAEVVMFGKRVHPCIQSTYCWLVLFHFGYAATMVLTFLGKLTLGRLRPHFMSVCDLDIGELCQDQVYIETYSCRGDPAILREARLSFPSGHSSGAFYPAVFVIVYMHYRIRSSPLTKACVQVLVLCFASFTAISRVADYKHHATDVLAGTVLAILMALLTTLGWGRIHEQKARVVSAVRESVHPLQSAASDVCTRIDIEPDMIVR